jgi:recombination protein RecT
VVSIESRIVREGDLFDWELGLEKKLRHKPSGKGELTHAYCIWRLKDGTVEFEVMDREQIIKIRNRSSAKTKDGDIFGPWKTDEEEMWRKTVLKRAMKYVPQSDDMARAFDREDDDADFSVVEDTSAHVLAATTGTSALRERVLRSSAPVPVNDTADGDA